MFRGMTQRAIGSAKRNSKKLVAGAGALAFSVSANATPLTSSDVDMSTASSDVGIVFLAILGVTVIVFGYRKVLSLANGR